MMYDPDFDKTMIGRKVIGVSATEETLWFIFNDGETQAFTVEGDCCSHSYFYDFVGLDKLIANGPVLSAKEISLGEPNDPDAAKGEVVVAYGFEFVTEHPVWGEQTSVLSFRNDSNGYYGGWMYATDAEMPSGLQVHTVDFTVPEIG